MLSNAGERRMKFAPRRLGAILVLCWLTPLWAAEIVVPPGDGTLAAAVASSLAGDTLILQDGPYSGDVTVNKSLTIRPLDRTTNAVIRDNLTIQGIDARVTLQGLKFLSTTYLVQAAAIRLLENEWVSGSIAAGDYRSADGDGSLLIVGNQINDGQIEDIRIDGAYVAGNVVVSRDGLDPAVSAESYVWIVGNEFVQYGSNDSKAITVAGGTAYIVANRVTCIGYKNSCIYSTASSALITDNIVKVYRTDTLLSGSQIGVIASFGKAIIVNNVVHGLSASTTIRSGSAISVSSTFARVAGNIIINYESTSATPINVTSVSAEVTHNLCFNSTGACPAGVGNLNEDPRFVDLVDYELDVGSPAIDAGPPDDGLADLDRTRNDMGAYGGPWSIGQYDAQREPGNVAPYVYPLFSTDTYLSNGVMEVRALGVARLR